jgi:MYXO-CTERM domain-containing protein
MSPRRRRLARPLPFAVVAAWLHVTPAKAATFTVTSTDASGPGTFAAAVDAANASAGADAITFQSGLTGTIALAGPLALREDVTITGRPTVTVSSQGRALVIDPAATSVTLRGLVVRKANGGAVYAAPAAGARLLVEDSIFEENQASSGSAGVWTERDTIIRRSRFARNKGVGASATGAAVNALQPGTRVEVEDTTFEENTSVTIGGAIIMAGGASLVVTRSTFRKNRSTPDGGAIYAAGAGTLAVSRSLFVGNVVIDLLGKAPRGGAVYTESGATFVNDTFSQNESPWGGSALWTQLGKTTLTQVTVTANVATVGRAAVHVAGGTLEVADSVLVDNTDPTSAGSDASASREGSGTFGATRALFRSAAGRLNGTDVGNLYLGDASSGLDVLADNGGSTQTHRLLPGSPAIDKGADTTMLDVDQRGAVRLVGTRTDLGAYEVTSCGSSTLEAAETCDDGAFQDGDGCSHACAVEPGWTCSGAPSVCTRQGAGDGGVDGGPSSPPSSGGGQDGSASNGAPDGGGASTGSEPGNTGDGGAGCSSVGVGGGPSAPWMLAAGLGFLAAARRRRDRRT